MHDLRGALDDESEHGIHIMLVDEHVAAVAPALDQLKQAFARIAEPQRVPPNYLELIMLDLKKTGLVKSARGPKGGYQLARPAEQISFGEIVRTMEGPIALVSCDSVNFYAPCGDCQDEATCAIRRAFAILRDQSTAVLDSISLAEGANWEERLGGA